MCEILECQEEIAERLNTVEELELGGVKAFAEDSHAVIGDLASWVQTGRTAIIVTTPTMTRNGASYSGEGIPCEMTLEIVCREKPALLRVARNSGLMTALDAAICVARALDGTDYSFRSIRQQFDAVNGILTATVEFNAQIGL